MADRIEVAKDLTFDELRAAARKEGNRRGALQMLAIANELDREQSSRPLNRGAVLQT